MSLNVIILSQTYNKIALGKLTKVSSYTKSSKPIFYYTSWIK